VLSGTNGSSRADCPLRKGGKEKKKKRNPLPTTGRGEKKRKEATCFLSTGREPADVSFGKKEEDINNNTWRGGEITARGGLENELRPGKGGGHVYYFAQRKGGRGERKKGGGKIIFL